jgi:hypothetical protein
VPAGEQGDLFIGGAGVARGYHGLPDATAKAFLPDPFFGPSSDARMYRTGDLARWNPDGTLDLIGRRDHQVKIRGHRIELGAVETTLRTLPGVRDAVVVPDAEHQRLVAFVQTDAGTPVDGLCPQLARILPPVMVPTSIRRLERFPMTVNGKVDRDALARSLETPHSARPPGTAAPEDVLAQVSEAWREILRTDDVPVDVNFFDAGGNSIAMFKLQDALERRTGKRPSVIALFRHTTVIAQTELIRKWGDSDGNGPSGTRDISALRAQALRARRQRTSRRAG